MGPELTERCHVGPCTYSLRRDGIREAVLHLAGRDAVPADTGYASNDRVEPGRML
jgi:hypothetical protein